MSRLTFPGPIPGDLRMNASAKMHPSDQTVRFFGLGKLDDAAGESVRKHLEGCPDCRRRVAEMTGDRSFDRLRGGTGEPASLPPVMSSLDGMTGRTAEPSSAERPPLGALPSGLAGHPDYEVIRELGRGGMGIVYLVHNKLMKRDEVLKVVGSHLIDRRGALDRFLAEIAARGASITRTSSLPTRLCGSARASSWPWSMSRASTSPGW